MKVRFFSRVFLVLGFICGPATFQVTAAPEKRNITEKDLFNFIWIGDTQVALDGSRLAFVRITVNDKYDGYNTSIWAVSTDVNEVPHLLTSVERVSSPRWSHVR